MGAVRNISEYQDYIQRTNELVEPAKQQQIKSLEIDFDEAIAEYEQEHPPIVIKFMGERYNVLPYLTTKVETFLIRSGKALNDDKANELLRLIMGEKFMDDISGKNVPSKVLADRIITPVLEMWGYKGTKHVDNPEPVKNVKTPGL